jgi:histidyl-tRNA synthetase
MSEKIEAPKGTRDFLPGSMIVREKIISTIEDVFKKYGFQKWDGPAFEYLSTLTLKSSPEIVREIYNFQDKAARDLGLRFELTASIARMMAANPRMKKPVKAYGIGKVWRYENTQKGRYREFLQMDADIFGCASMNGELELFSIATSVLQKIGFSSTILLVNSRKILNGIAAAAGIKEEKKQDVFRAFDKLNKIGMDGVKKEFLTRGLTEKDFDNVKKILEECRTSGAENNRKVLEKLSELLKNDSEGVEGVREIEALLELAGSSGLAAPVLDISLIRGFDYYTGPVYEIRVKGNEDYGSISGGGRYDKLIEVFGGPATPAVGISFGIERIIDIIESDDALRSGFSSGNVDLFVACFGQTLFLEAYKVASFLRMKGIGADLDLLARNINKQMEYANEHGYRKAVIVGEEEVKSGIYTLKDMGSGEQKKLKLEEIALELARK